MRVTRGYGRHPFSYLVIYAKQIDLEQEEAVAKWLRNDIRERNKDFAWEGMRVWDEGGSGDFGEFLKSFIGSKWHLLSLSN